MPWYSGWSNGLKPVAARIATENRVQLSPSSPSLIFHEFLPLLSTAESQRVGSLRNVD
jgi:hypothetical protein